MEQSRQYTEKVTLVLTQLVGKGSWVGCLSPRAGMSTGNATTTINNLASI